MEVFLYFYTSTGTSLILPQSGTNEKKRSSNGKTLTGVPSVQTKPELPFSILKPIHAGSPIIYLQNKDMFPTIMEFLGVPYKIIML